MIDFFASLTVGLIIVMTLVILISNYRQARALYQMRNVMRGWVDAQLRDRREKRNSKISIKEPLKWFGSQVNLVLTDLLRNMDQPPVLEFLAEQGMRLVVSPLPPRNLRSALRPVESKKRKIIKLVDPLLGTRRRDVSVVERNQDTSGEWFDLEAKSAAAAFTVNWPDCSRLWFYIISPRRVQQENLLKFDWQSVKDWYLERKNKVTTWFKTLSSKSSS